MPIFYGSNPQRFNKPIRRYYYSWSEMRRKLLRSDQVVALKDYPLHNEHVLKIYFRVFNTKHGKILPSCPVIHKSRGVPFSLGRDRHSKDYNRALENFLKSHPKVQYFLIDGNHKSTAAALAGQRIPSLILESDGDVKKAKRMIKSDELFGVFRLGNTLQGEIDLLAKHFRKNFGKKPAFYTVAEKTKLLVRNRKVPKYMFAVRSGRK